MKKNGIALAIILIILVMTLVACGENDLDTCVHNVVIDEAVPATCTKTGLTEGKHCSKCGKVLLAQTEVPATNHTYGDWVEIKLATCTEDGLELRNCICGATETKVIKATGHSHVATVTYPTCIEEGYTTYTCHCGDTYVADIVAALGHDTIDHEAQAPTCTEIGWDAYVTCSRCDYTTYAEIPATNHIDVNPADNSCDNCGEKVSTLTFTLSGDGQSYAITDAKSSISGDITLPSTYNGKPVTTIGYRAFWYCDSLTSIVIPDSVTTIVDVAFYYCDSLTSVTIPDSVTTIGDHAFEGCTSLTSVTFGENSKLPTIGYEVFCGCRSLTSIVIPDSVTRIDSSAFKGCTSLTSVTFGANSQLTTIGRDAFHNCTSLTSVTIPDSVTTIDMYAFSDCTSLTSVVIPDGVTSIYSGAFSGCRSLISITIPFVGAKAGVTSSSTYQFPLGYIFGESSYTGSVATAQDYYGSSTSSTTITGYYIPSSLKSVTVTGGYIPTGAFDNCKNITNITLGDDVTSIGSRAFSGCDSLTDVYYTGDIAGWCGISFGNGSANPMYYADNLYIDGKLVEDLVIPDSVTSIGDYAFRGCDSLTSVTFGENSQLTTIGSYAFAYCSNLTSVTIGNSVTRIGSSAFSGCSSLESLTIPFVGAKAGVTGSSTYQSPLGYLFGTSSYTGGVATTQNYYGSSTSSTTSTTYYIPSSLKSVTVTGGNILYGAFDNCKNITNITLGDDVTSIGSRAFYGCTGLTSISVDENNPNYKSIDGNLYSKDGKMLIQYAIGKTATSFVIPDSVTTIGEEAFYGCTSLTSITIPDSVTTIGDHAFANCDSLTYNTYDNAQYLGNEGNPYLVLVEATSTSITSCEINENCKFVCLNAFYSCDSLTSITIPDSVTTIGSYAFEGCTSLTSVTFGENSKLTTIGEYAFSNCTSLTSIVIPDRVTTIGDYAFSDCTSLTSVTIGENSQLTTIGDYAFHNCTSLTSIVIPDRVTTIGDYAFSGCSSLESLTIPFVGAKAGVTSFSTYQYPLGYLFGTSSYTGGFATEQYYYGSSKYSTTSTTYYIPSSLKSVTVTGGNILYGAFYNCKNITNITLGDDVTSIGDSAFRGCDSLTSVTFEENSQLTTIGYGAFYDCTSLTSIVIPDSVTRIGSSAFGDCTSLTSVTIGNSVTTIGSYAFYNCTSLTDVYYEGTEEQWKAISIDSYNSSLANATIHYNYVNE